MVLEQCSTGVVWRDNGLLVRALNICWKSHKQISFLFSSGEYYLGYKKFDLKGTSWYNLLHPECIKEVQSKHRLSKQPHFTTLFNSILQRESAVFNRV